MIVLVAGALALPVVAAWLAIELVWPPRSDSGADRMLRASLAIGIGLGASSTLYALWLVLFGPARVALLIFELLVAIGLGRIVLKRSRMTNDVRRSTLVAQHPAQGSMSDETASGDRSGRWFWVERALVPTLVLLLAVRAVQFALGSGASPHGRWDAWTIWNLRARFLFHAGDEWRQAFAPLLAWTHLDYPLLVPASVAHAWTLIASDTASVSIAIAGLFTFANVMLLASGLASLRSRRVGAMAGIVLLATAAFVGYGASQNADIPLAFFLLASIVLIVLADTGQDQRERVLVLAGLAAGLAVWTKNEGFVFLAIIALARLLIGLVQRDSRRAFSDLALVAAGALPWIILNLAFKIAYAPPNDIVASLTVAGTLERLTDLSRYAYVIGRYAREFATGGAWIASAPLVLAIYFLLSGPRIDARLRVGTLWAGATVIGMYLAYLAAYQFTPHDVVWHMDTSLRRLLLQLWPSVLFAFFLVVRDSENQPA